MTHAARRPEQAVMLHSPAGPAASCPRRTRTPSHHRPATCGVSDCGSGAPAWRAQGHRAGGGLLRAYLWTESVPVD